jgi:hypothetical protein
LESDFKVNYLPLLVTVDEEEGSKTADLNTHPSPSITVPNTTALQQLCFISDLRHFLLQQELFLEITFLESFAIWKKQFQKMFLIKKFLVFD